MDEAEPRYEFRVWGEDPSPLRNRLERFATPVKAASRETYLISRATDACNAKIRADLMDIKLLIAERWKLEQWKPVVKAAFPLNRRIIVTEIFPRLEIQPPHLSKARYAIDEFLEVMGAEPGMTIVELSKTRYRFQLERCESEFTEVIFNDAAHKTVAIESVDPDELLRVAHELGIHGMENVNYVRYIKGELGLGKP
jgi:exopolyphosphatase / guanosine-5'-triphosphate,3'-diphosphate pyrophosphatase